MIGPSMMGVSVVILLVAMLGGSALAKLQGWRHISGAIVFPVGVTIVIPQGDGLVAIPSSDR
jgi:formate/nitrite transporter FocA (FNT family)